MENDGATVIITHHILEGKQPEYEDWLNEIGPMCRKSAGNIDWQIIRPIPKLTFAYTVIVRFDTIENLRSWIESAERRDLVKKAAPLFAGSDKYYIKSGLDFLFLPETNNAKVPVRWKQYLVTWSAIYPLSMAMPLGIIPVLRLAGLHPNRYLDSLVISGVIVLTMVYFLMPNYTKLIRKWLYK